jgi:EpsD family peptidyl-prolyl cis-trans isomerase
MSALTSHIRRIAGILCAASLLAACGADEGGKKTATQSAARVNGADITVHQINQVLSRLQGVTEQNLAQARGEVLDRLIDQQLVIEQALDKKLDRQPEVMAALEAARRDVLARAHLDQVAKVRAKPTPEEGRKYYDTHPELFAQRRIYNLQELTLEKNDAMLPALRDKIASAKSMDELVAWLKEKNVRFAAKAGVRPAEQIPLELLGTLHRMKEGQATLIDGPQGTVIVRVAAVQAVPVDEATAMPRIQQFLANQQGKEAVETEMKRLRANAKIEYLGEYADASKAGTPGTKTAASPLAEEAPAGNVGKAVDGLK